MRRSREEGMSTTQMCVCWGGGGVLRDKEGSEKGESTTHTCSTALIQASTLLLVWVLDGIIHLGV